MTILAEFAITTDGFELGSYIADRPGLSAELERVVPTPGRAIPYVWVPGPRPPRDLLRALSRAWLHRRGGDYRPRLRASRRIRRAVGPETVRGKPGRDADEFEATVGILLREAREAGVPLSEEWRIRNDPEGRFPSWDVRIVESPNR